MTLAITLSLWRAEHISQARCVAAGPRARAEPPWAQPGADGGSRQPARGRGRGGGCGPGVRWRGGGDKALGGRGDAWRETETNTSASGLAGRPARRFAGPAGRHGFRRRAIISLAAAARLLSGRGGKRTGHSRLVPASVRTPRTPGAFETLDVQRVGRRRTAPGLGVGAQERLVPFPRPSLSSNNGY